MRDEGHGVVVVLGRQLADDSADGARPAARTSATAAGEERGVRAHDPWLAGEEVGARGHGSGPLAAGHRVAADVAGQVDPLVLQATFSGPALTLARSVTVASG